MPVLDHASPVCFAAITDGAKARSFYGDLLGLAVLDEDGFALVLDNLGVPLRLAKVQSFTPQQFTVLGWEVEDLAGAVDRLAAAGIAFERYPGMGQDERGIWRPPGTTAGVAWFKDPFGNLLSFSGSMTT